MYFFVFNKFFYEPPNIHNLALVGLYSMMSVFLLILIFDNLLPNTFCYSNIYTTYIAIYVTSQQRMVSKENKNKRQQNKKRNSLQHVSWGRGGEGQRKISTKFGTENLYTNLQSEKCDCAIKKKRRAWDVCHPQLRNTRYPLSGFKFSFLFLFCVFVLFFFCKMAFRHFLWNEVVHTSVYETYTVHWAESMCFSKKEKIIITTRFAFEKPPL